MSNACMENCLNCKGTGKGQPIPSATGFESAGRINAWAMSQPCNWCDGKGKVSKQEYEKQLKKVKEDKL